MGKQKKPIPSKGKENSNQFPVGRIKIAQAMDSLLEKKDFNAITTAEIARTAGFTEALIYKYYKDKRDLLHQVLISYNDDFLVQLVRDLKGIKGALNKLRKTIWSSLHCYATNRVYAKILVLEVRNYPEYFNSEAYEGIKTFGNILLDIIEEGVNEGEIREDVPSTGIRQFILGSIEHICLPKIIFNKEIDPDELTDQLCNLVFSGIKRP